MSKIGDLVLELQEKGKIELHDGYNDNSEMWIAHEKLLASNDNSIDDAA